MTTSNFYLIDKPIGITSFDILRNLRKKLNIKKMGHTGTLDPLATGLVLVAVGDYTKLIPYFEKDSKVYEFKINLNGTTPSFDVETEISFLPEYLQEKYKKELTLDKIEKILKEKFTGKITQLPPKYSALKVGGKKALDMVRNGEDFELKERGVEIFSIEILSYNYPKILVKAKVSAGTYIRSIANDLGAILGTGGYITYLRRVGIGNLDLTFSQKLDYFDAGKYLDMEKLFGKEKFLTLDDDILSKINNGLKIEIILPIENGDYFIKDSENIVTNIIHYDGTLLIPKRKI